MTVDVPVFLVIVLVLVVFLFIRYVYRHRPSGMRTLTVKVTEQERTLKNLQSLYRASLLELEESLRLVREQNNVINTLRRRIRELEEKIGLPSPSISVLGIWPYPQSELNTQMEEMSIYNAGFDYRRLRGEYADRSGVMREVRRSDVHIVEIGSHGTRDGIMLHDGQTPPGWWARALQDTSVRLMVLMACESEHTGYALRRAGVPYVITVQEKIRDVDAITFVRNFYDYLAESGVGEYDGIRRAFDYARLTVPHDSSQMISLMNGGGERNGGI